VEEKMSVLPVVFLAVAAVTLLAAIMVVSASSLVHSALWLVMTLFGVGVLYVLLEAGFFAVAQVLIYIGAIAILFIFAVMLTRKIMVDTGPRLNSSWWLAALISIVIFAGIVLMLSQSAVFTMLPPEFTTEQTTLTELGQALVSPTEYLLPFELASVLLMAAMIGAIYVAWVKK
jgi:NADH-quinone oxidoreductase subunit J